MSKKDTQAQEQAPAPEEYRYLPGMLHRVRWVQHFAAIVAEILILLAFFASGMDVSMGGVMANMPSITWAWAAVFALGVDTSFVISWVRCRQLGRSWHLLWSIPVALGMSFVVFQPVMIQLLQQALNINFTQALDLLGINIVVLVYARAIVAVTLGAILALTNVEHAAPAQGAQKARRRVVLFERALNKIAPVVSDPLAQIEQPVQVTITPEQESPLKQIEGVRLSLLHVVDAGADVEPVERVRAALEQEPDCSDRLLGRLTDLAPATAKKHRLTIEQQKSQAM